MYSFFVDAYGSEVSLYYRTYPDLCVKTVADMIARIRDIELGKWTYPIEQLRDFADVSGANIYDVVRADLGLPPRETVTLRRVA
jgi:hypothetical protein